MGMANPTPAFWPTPLDSIIQPYVTLFEADGEESYLALWHGWTPALAVSAAVWLFGALLALGVSLDGVERPGRPHRQMPCAVSD